MKPAVQLILAIIIIPALLLAGCKRKQTTPAEEITLVYWSMWNEDEPVGQTMKHVIDVFETDNANVNIEVVWNGRENRNLIVPALEAGEVIDLADADTGHIARNFVKYALPLDEYLDQPAVGQKKKTVRQTVIPSLLTQYLVDGKVISMPFAPFAVMFFYNKEHFDDAGITQPPETWKDFMAANEALKKAGYAPITTDVDAYLDIHIGYYAARAVGRDGLAEAMADRTGEAWRNPAWLKMAQDFRTLLDKGYIAKGTEGNLWPAGQQSVALDKVSMCLNGTWLPNEVREIAGPDFRWGSFPFPRVEGGVGSNKDLMMGSQGMMISNVSNHPDRAFEFIKYLVSMKVQEEWVESTRSSAVVGVEWYGSIAEAGKVVNKAETGFGWAADLWNGGEIVSNVVMPAFTDLFVGKLTPEEYVERMIKESADFWKGRE